MIDCDCLYDTVGSIYLPVLLKVMILLLVVMVLEVLMDDGDDDDDSFLELINPRLKLDSLPLLDIEYR